MSYDFIVNGLFSCCVYVVVCCYCRPTDRQCCCVVLFRRMITPRTTMRVMKAVETMRMTTWMLTVTTSNCRSLGRLVLRALDSQLGGCEFDSLPSRCRVTTLGKLFTPTCVCRSHWSSGSGQTGLWEDPGSNLTVSGCVYHNTDAALHLH